MSFVVFPKEVSEGILNSCRSQDRSGAEALGYIRIDHCLEQHLFYLIKAFLDIFDTISILFATVREAMYTFQRTQLVMRAPSAYTDRLMFYKLANVQVAQRQFQSMQ